MKTDILKALRRLRLPALALAAFLASCTSELAHEPAPGGGSQAGEAEVTLRLQVPGAAAAGRTRAVGDNAERTVNDLYILAFKVDGGVETFDYYAVARKGTEDLTTGVSKWTASLRPKDYEQTFVMIANAQGTPGDVNTQIAALVDDGAGGTSVGEYKETVLEKLTDKLTADEQTAGFNAKSDNDHHPFTMYGQTAATKIELGKDVSLTVALHRIVARVNMAFTGDATTNFTASKVYLCNFTDRARVIPNGLGQTTGADYEPAATIPADAQKLPAAFDALGNIPTYEVDKATHEVKNQIYLFETNQPAPDDADAHLKRPCLVVWGEYQGYKGYYRMDFATQDAATGDVTYRDIIRNHSYNFTVTNVSGRGSASLEEAMNEKASNLTADMILWDDNVIGNIDFEGDRVLGISTNRYELIKSGGTKLLQVRATKNVTWTANIYAAKPDGSTDTQAARPAWINFADADGNVQGGGKTLADQTGVDALQDVYFTVDVNDERPERQAVIRLTDERGRLSVEAVVTQNQVEIPVYLRVVNGQERVSEIEFDQLKGETIPFTVEFGPDDVELSWEIAVDEGEKGINMKEVTVGGIKYDNPANMKGVIQPTSANNSVLMEPFANGFTTTEVYGTRRGRLMLIATRPTTGETEVLDIPIYQKKYGLVIDKTEVLCGGQEVLIYVKGNMPWSVSIPTDDQGYKNAWNDDLIIQFDNTQWGNPSETAWVEKSVVRIQTQPTPTKERKADPNYYKTKLTFKHRKTNFPIDPIEIDFKPGILAIDEWPDYNKITKIYEVYGPVQRSVNTKNNAYTEDPAVTGATIMNYAQGYALTQADEFADWGVCKESEVKHEFVVNDRGVDIYTGSHDSNLALAVSALSLGYGIYERVGMTYTQAKSYREFRRQGILEITVSFMRPSHTHAWLTFTKKGNNFEFDVNKVGYLTNDKYGNPTIFNALANNVRWNYASGDVGFNMPVQMYGGKASATFKPTYYRPGEQYELSVTRKAITTPYDLAADKAQNYPTYYFKLLKTE